jgi:hypothetical protein
MQEPDAEQPACDPGGAERGVLGNVDAFHE